MAYTIKRQKLKEEKLKDSNWYSIPETRYDVETSEDVYIFRNKKDSRYTVEIAPLLNEGEGDEEGFVSWYGYSAKDGKGIPDTLEYFSTKEDGLKWAKEYMKEKK